MQFKQPKNNEKYWWTNHVTRKMAYYGLSPSRVLRIIRAPQRMETGVVENTLAAMQVAGNKKKPTEIWAMWAEKGKKKIIITAWRYPGVSPIRDQIPIPQEILAELRSKGLSDILDI